MDRCLSMIFSWKKRARVLSAMAAAAVILISAAFFIYGRGTRRKRDPVKDGYLEFCRRLAGMGAARESWQGPSDFARSAAEKMPELKSRIDEITALYIQLRYAEKGGKEVLNTFKKRVRELRT